MKKIRSLVAAIEFYLETRRQLGFGLRQEGRVLMGLGQFAQETHHRGPLTAQLVLDWAQLPKAANRLWWARRLEMACRFARFWVAYDPKTEIPPAGVFGPAYCRRAVHIYSPEEIQELLAAAAELKPLNSWRPRLFHTLLGLLACTGLRISEALQLCDRDIDWKLGTLTVRKAKFGQHRRLPLHASTQEALNAYYQNRKHVRTKPEQPFFSTPNGRALTYFQASHTFAQLRLRLGWTQMPLPRLHDLRHTVAVGCLIRWYRQGEDVGQKILALSVYLGHRQISSTYWYLTAVPELLALANARWENPTDLLSGGADA